MSIGVIVLHDEAWVADEIAHAVDRCEGMHLAGLDPDAGGASVVLAGGAPLARVRVRGRGLVVVSVHDAVADARAGFELGAAALLRWPDDAAELGRAVARASGRAESAASPSGRVVAVAGARGGAGATTVTALLAAAIPGSLIVDASGGQIAFAPDGVTGGSLERALHVPAPEVVAASAEPHACGRALYGGAVAGSVEPVLEAARGAASLVLVDAGRDAGLPADATVLVCGDDLASLRAARALLDEGGVATFVLNRFRRRGVRPYHLRRALGASPAVVLRRDPRLARAADLARRPRVPRAMRSFAARIAGGLA